MSFLTTIPREPVLDMVSLLGPWGWNAVPNQFAGGSQAFETANRTVYYPIFVPVRCPVQRVWWVNGSDVSVPGTVAVGVYTSADFKPAARITTASAAQGTANQLQFATPASVKWLLPGLYWLGLSNTLSAATASVGGTALQNANQISVKYDEDGQNCPATATPTQSNNANVYNFGFSTVTSP